MTIEAKQWRKVRDLEALSDDESDDALFRGKDRAWAALVELFEERRVDEGLTLEQLGKRIGRTRAEVHRWLSSSMKMSLRALGLLAEGLDAELYIEVKPRIEVSYGTNHKHPSEVAISWIENVVAAPAVGGSRNGSFAYADISNAVVVPTNTSNVTRVSA